MMVAGFKLGSFLKRCLLSTVYELEVGSRLLAPSPARGVSLWVVERRGMNHWKETAEILARLAELKAAGKSAALATVTHIVGSAYRRPGAKFLIEETGDTLGSVSGGCLEADVREVAKAVLATGCPSLRHYSTGCRRGHRLGPRAGMQWVGGRLRPAATTGSSGGADASSADSPGRRRSLRGRHRRGQRRR